MLCEVYTQKRNNEYINLIKEGWNIARLRKKYLSGILQGFNSSSPNKRDCEGNLSFNSNIANSLLKCLGSNRWKCSSVTAWTANLPLKWLVNVSLIYQVTKSVKIRVFKVFWSTDFFIFFFYTSKVLSWIYN